MFALIVDICVFMVTIVPTPRGVSSHAPLLLCTEGIIPRVGRTGIPITLILGQHFFFFLFVLICLVGFKTLRRKFKRDPRMRYHVEYRPPGCRWKLWLGGYNSERDAQRAYDVVLFYTGNGDTRKLYFEDTPFILEQVCLPIKPFSLVSKDRADQQYYAQELRSIARAVIRKGFQDNFSVSMGSSSEESPIQVNYFIFAITN